MSTESKKPGAKPAGEKKQVPVTKMARVKRSILPFVLGAVVGVGGLMGYEYVSGSGQLSIMQHLAGDSAAVAAADSAAATSSAPAADSLAPLALDTMPSVAIDTMGMAAADSAAAYGTPVEAPRDTVNRLAPRRLAKFFGSMQAREAARVLEKMTDPEVETILTQLSDREAASILSNLTPERAAQISQVVISGERTYR